MEIPECYFSLTVQASVWGQTRFIRCILDFTPVEEWHGHIAKEYVRWEVLLCLSLKNLMRLKVSLAALMGSWGRMEVAGTKDRLSKNFSGRYQEWIEVPDPTVMHFQFYLKLSNCSSTWQYVPTSTLNVPVSLYSPTFDTLWYREYLSIYKTWKEWSLKQT